MVVTEQNVLSRGICCGENSLLVSFDQKMASDCHEHDSLKVWWQLW